MLSNFEFFMFCLHTISFICAILLNLTIFYKLSTKHSDQKTSFDLVLKDTVLSIIVQMIILYTICLSEIFFEIVPIKMNIILSVMFYFMCCFSFASCLITVLLKYYYLTYGYIFLELSDKLVRSCATSIKISLTGCSILVDQIGPIGKHPFTYPFMSPNTEVNW